MNWKDLSIILMMLLFVFGSYIIIDLVRPEEDISNGENGEEAKGIDGEVIIRVENITIENVHLNRIDYDPWDEEKNYDHEFARFQPNATFKNYDDYSDIDLRYSWNLLILNSTGKRKISSSVVGNGIIITGEYPPFPYNDAAYSLPTTGRRVESRFLNAKGSYYGVRRGQNYTFYLQIVIFKGKSIVYMQAPTEISIEI
jgi:hypothetical protein